MSALEDRLIVNTGYDNIPIKFKEFNLRSINLVLKTLEARKGEVLLYILLRLSLNIKIYYFLKSKN